MLAAWFRMKYPASTAGAIAASAPIVQIPGIMDPRVFYKTITDVYRAANPIAPQAIYNTWQALLTLGATAAGRQSIASAMRLCSVPSSLNDVYGVYNYWQNAITYTSE